MPSREGAARAITPSAPAEADPRSTLTKTTPPPFSLFGLARGALGSLARMTSARSRSRSTAGWSASTPPFVDAAVVPADLSGESDVVHAAIATSLGAVELGQLGDANAVHPSVQAFATQVVSEYGVAVQRQRDLATRLELIPTDNPVSEELEEETDTALVEIQSAPIGDFDHAYMTQQEAMFERLLALLDETLIPAASDVELQTALSGTRQAVAGHLARARAILFELSLEGDGGVAVEQGGAGGDGD